MKRLKKIKTGDVCIYLLAIHMFLLIINGTKFFSIGNRSYVFALLIVMSAIFSFSNESRGFCKGITVSVEKIFTLLLIVYTLYSVLFVRQEFDRGTFLAAILLFVLLFFWSNFQFSLKQIKKLENSYIFSALILAIGIIICRYQPYADMGISRMTILSYTGEYYDVNFISAYIATPTILLLYKYFNDKKNYLVAVWALIMLVAILMTGSRTALGVVAIAIVFILYKQRKNRFTILVISSVLIVLVPTVVQFLPDDIFTHYSRGLNFLKDSRRMDDWMTGIKLILDKPGFGHGLVSSKSLIVEYFDVTWVTVHNTYLVFMVNFGVICGSLIIMLLLIPLFRLIKYKAPYGYYLAYGMFLLSILLIEANFSDIMIIPMCIFYSIGNYFKRVRQNHV